MAVEAFVVQLQSNCGPEGFKRVIDQIRAWQGDILVKIHGGRTIIVSMDSQCREPLQAMPQVILVGGVQIQPQPLRRIRVDRSGHCLDPKP